MSTSVLHILASKPIDAEMEAALAAGWTRSDLSWERLQEEGNLAFESGKMDRAAKAWFRARWIGALRFAAFDPRRATTLANLALIDRQSGREAPFCKGVQDMGWRA